MQARRRVNLSNFQVPEYDGDVTPSVISGEILALMRDEERRIEQQSTLEQHLSMRLAHVYGRNVFCSLGVPVPFVFDLGGGRIALMRQIPSERLIREGIYLQMKCSGPAARALLQRDERQSLVSMQA